MIYTCGYQNTLVEDFIVHEVIISLNDVIYTMCHK